MMSELLIIGITLLAAIVAALAQYTFKRSVPTFDFNRSHLRSLLLSKGLWIGGIAYLVSLVIYLKALGSGQLSFVYPTFASTFIFIALISHFVLREKLSIGRMMGIGLVVLGIVIVALTY